MCIWISFIAIWSRRGSTPARRILPRSPGLSVTNLLRWSRARSTSRYVSAPARQVWLAARHEVAWFEGAIVTLRAIKQRYPDVLLGAVSNGTTDLNRIPEAKGLFDFSMSALDANCTKPEPEIYLKAIQAAKAVPPIRPEETVFIGDDFLNDVCGPTRVGLKTIWMNAKQRPMTTAEPITGKPRPGYEKLIKESYNIRPTKTILDIRQLIDALDDLQAALAYTASKGPSSGSVKEGENAVEAATAEEPSEVEKVDPMRTRLSAVPKPESGIARRSVEEALLDERRKKYLELYESTGTTRYLPPRDP
ncbi:hypothetical protein FOZ62_031306 [Perkinsus olseni]|uniref:Haloacid dehalogenase-like hydrolase domain-containing protein 3 n=1 Tax=Perkinsus olseni TaxID=32597 RepID=A0A7J6RJQ9_PEROL|nr:hypothetical protein FOZ62_031306 [Perkinsus olseni]